MKTLFRFLALTLAAALLTVGAAADTRRPLPAPLQFDINQSVIKQPLADGVSADDAIEAMKSKAIALNMKFVAHQPLSQELQARGIKSGRLEIFQFCNPMDAYEMVKFNPVFAAYMPCRIALVEDQEGKTWLMMLNLDMVIDNTPLTPEVKAIAARVNTTLKTILEAAAAGEF
ncbi:MAG: hypothetical protein CVV05_07630 [Gammaproteobacteria bacterium HGW-Gammaproteobacteria-1]|jgi:uncharacterized protein (DUF302 family)|nr:MAG: hypothetical protein CVV05_07630 [Gammaproteobacteria bacterium HGW-Gammaproteobacteria-1]